MRSGRLATAFLLCTTAAAAAQAAESLNYRIATALAEASSLAKEHECTIAPISCGQTVIASINGFECDLGSGGFVDFWSFQGLPGQRVVIDTVSDDLDTFLALLDPTPTARASDDDGGGGSDSHLEFTLDLAGTWTIGISNIVPFDLGGYVLHLDCPLTTAPPPPAVPALTSSQYPNFRFWVEISDTRIGTSVADCLPETVCVAGAIPTRAEVFLRIVGPKPNGKLWPNIVKFNTTKTEVWIQQISTGLIKYYLLPQLPTDSDELPGIVDKDGFAP